MIDARCEVLHLESYVVSDFTLVRSTHKTSPLNHSTTTKIENLALLTTHCKHCRDGASLPKTTECHF
jgi:hypothetical protein